MSQKDLAEWAFKRTAAQHLAKPAHLFLDCARNDHMLMTNASSIQTEKRKSEGMHPEFEKALRTWVNEIHAQKSECFFENDKRDGH